MYMKKYSLWFLPFCLVALFFQSCDHQKSYAEMLKEEKELIQRFIEKENIQVITPEQFYAQDSTTDVTKNQFVLFKDNGVYMQIVNKGKGRKAENGDEVTVRFMEENLSTGDSISSLGISAYLDVFRYVKTSTAVKGQLIDNGGLMYNYYGPNYGTSIPSGWLVPLEYVKLSTSVSDRAYVQLILPAKMGQGDAIKYVYPCYYKLFYQLPKQ